MKRPEARVTTTDHWEYLDVTGQWLEPDFSGLPDEAIMRATELGTAYRHVVVRRVVRHFRIAGNDTHQPPTGGFSISRGVTK